MNAKEFREFITKQRWIFAKSYALFAPHEYIVRGKHVGSDEEFLDFANTILEHGMRMFYYKTERKYIYIGGWFYWICWDGSNDGKKVEDDPTAVVNRCRPEDYDIVFMKKGTQSGKNARVAPQFEQMEFAWD